MRRDDNNTLQMFLGFGLLALVVGGLTVLTGRPHTDDEGQATGAVGYIVFGSIVGMLGQLMVLFSLVGYGVRTGILAARQLEAADTESRATAQRALDEGA